jgi:hypothetical protein
MCCWLPGFWPLRDGFFTGVLSEKKEVAWAVQDALPDHAMKGMTTGKII